MPEGEGETVMTTWTSDELLKIGTADELQVSSLRRDGTVRRPRTIWVVRHGDDLYVRSVNGRTSAWFSGVQDRHEGNIQAGGVGKNVTFVEVGHDIDDEIDAIYRNKYHRYAQSSIDHITSPDARSATLKVVPRS
jgi:hypothetical protein